MLYGFPCVAFAKLFIENGDNLRQTIAVQAKVGLPLAPRTLHCIFMVFCLPWVAFRQTTTRSGKHFIHRSNFIMILLPPGALRLKWVVALGYIYGWINRTVKTLPWHPHTPQGVARKMAKKNLPLFEKSLGTQKNT